MINFFTRLTRILPLQWIWNSRLFSNICQKQRIVSKSLRLLFFSSKFFLFRLSIGLDLVVFGDNWLQIRIWHAYLFSFRLDVFKIWVNGTSSLSFLIRWVARSHDPRLVIHLRWHSSMVLYNRVLIRGHHVFASIIGTVSGVVNRLSDCHRIGNPLLSTLRTSSHAILYWWFFRRDKQSWCDTLTFCLENVSPVIWVSYHRLSSLLRASRTLVRSNIAFSIFDVTIIIISTLNKLHILNIDPILLDVDRLFLLERELIQGSS